jgi:mannose-1-phosphate guanylyltransferase
MRRRWAVVLAGGEGSRLHSVTTALTGEPVPKQFCRLLTGQTLLEETRQRLSLLVDGTRTTILVSRQHAKFYEYLKRERPAARLIEQPSNRATAVAIALALGCVKRLQPDAVVGFFPSDHHYTRVGAFAQIVSTAYLSAELLPDRLVLVGAGAQGPEPDYGWIEPGVPLSWPVTDHRLFAVRSFWEKPAPLLAQLLFRRSCLWNTFTTIGSIDAFRAAFHIAQPGLAAMIDEVASATPGAVERAVIDQFYRQPPGPGFSEGVLARVPDRCVVTPLRDSGWTDVGHPDRLAQVQRLQSALPA